MDRSLAFAAIRLELLRRALKLCPDGDLAEVLKVAGELEAFVFAEDDISPDRARAALETLKDAGNA